MLIVVGATEDAVRELRRRVEARELGEFRTFPALPPVDELEALDPCLVVLAPDRARPMEDARAIKARLRDTAVLVLADPELRAQLEHRLLLTPFHGAPVRVVEASGDVAGTIAEAFEVAELSRQQRLIVQRLNRDLATRAAPESVETYLAELLDLAPFGMIVATTQGEIVAINQQARGLLGYRPASKARFPDVIAEADRARAEALLARAVAQPVVRLRVAEDARRWVEARAALTVREGTDRVLILVADATRAVENEQALANAQTQLARSEKMSLMGEIVGGVAHEVRTPLTALQNHLTLLELSLGRLGSASPEVVRRMEDHLRAAGESVDRIAKLVADMRRYVQGHSSAREPLLLAAPVSEALDFLERTLGSRIRLERRLSDARPVLVDAFQVQQVVINLVNNASDASRPGGVVLIETWDEEDAGVLAVTDRGSGIPPEIRARLFEAFVTTKAHGTGLGLGIVRRIVEQHGGDIQVESEVGRGTRILVRWPRAEAPQSLQAPSGIRAT